MRWWCKHHGRLVLFFVCNHSLPPLFTRLSDSFFYFFLFFFSFSFFSLFFSFPSPKKTLRFLFKFRGSNFLWLWLSIIKTFPNKLFNHHHDAPRLFNGRFSYHHDDPLLFSLTSHAMFFTE